MLGQIWGTVVPLPFSPEGTYDFLWNSCWSFSSPELPNDHSSKQDIESNITMLHWVCPSLKANIVSQNLMKKCISSLLSLFPHLFIFLSLFPSVLPLHLLALFSVQNDRAAESPRGWEVRGVWRSRGDAINWQTPDYYVCVRACVRVCSYNIYIYIYFIFFVY